jgi:hypothetical protein
LGTCGTISRDGTCDTGVPEGRKAVVEGLMTENSQNVKENINLEIHEAQRNSKRVNSKRSS